MPMVRVEEVLLPLLLAAVSSTGDIPRAREYCESETFRARCRSNEVILMQSALYGRMRLGRCVEADLGYLGCTMNVLHLADKRCSGRRECEIRIPDAELDATKPCFKELKTYMEASYTCVPVTMINEEKCDATQPMTMNFRAEGYLASVVTEESGCGSSSTPWVINAFPGQRINLTIFDFTTFNAVGNADYVSAGDYCAKYGAIEEPAVGVRMIICKGRNRVRQLYMSRKNKLLVHIERDRDGRTPGYFLLKYEIIGCPSEDVKTSESFNHLDKLSTSIPGCEPIVREEHKLCDDWLGNCSKIDPPRPTDVSLSVAIIVGITIAVSLLMVTFGAIIIKCGRRKRSESELTRISGLESNLYGNRSEAMATNSRVYDDKNLTYTTCRECLAEINISNYSHMLDYAKPGGTYSWSASAMETSNPDDDSSEHARQQTCNSSCNHQGDAGGIVLQEILSKISEEDENIENSRIIRANEETELNGEKPHCDETHYLLSGNIATNDNTHCSQNNFPINVLCNT